MRNSSGDGSGTSAARFAKCRAWTWWRTLHPAASRYYPEHTMPATPTASATLVSEESPFLTETEAANRLKMSPKTLRNWRSAGQGPTFLRFGSLIRYSTVALDAWGYAQVAA